MARWRKPPETSSPYITLQGYRGLEDELKTLWKKRAEVTRALSAAAAEGDRSENAEYIYRKKELRGIDSRIGYLQKRMPRLNIVSTVSDRNRVFFGAGVQIEDDDGRQFYYRIIGADELDGDPRKISVDSPMAKALLGKTAGDDIELQTGGQIRGYFIISIEYAESS